MAKQIKKHGKFALILSLILIMVAMYGLIPLAEAAGLSSIKCTLDDSRPTTGSKQTINFTTTNAVTAGQTIKIGYADDWTIPSFTTSDVTFTGATLVDSCDAETDEVTMTTSDTGGDKHVTFTVCTGDTVTAGAKVITLGTGATKITTPTTSASYTISIGGTMTDSGNAMVYIISGVSVSATVAETLSFVIDTVASAQTVNGATTNVATTSGDEVDFGTVSTTTNKIAAHDLKTTTNAGTGYTATTKYTQTLQIDATHDIDDLGFTNGSPGTFPETATDEDFGYTTDDATLAGTPGRFISDKWAKFETNPYEVAYHDGPADGTTAGSGKIRVGYQVGVAGITPAGEHTTTIIYVCTPIF